MTDAPMRFDRPPGGSAPPKVSSHQTLRWREMDSNFRFLVARPSNRHGRSDRFLETWSGSVGEPEVRIHLPPAWSQLRTSLVGPGLERAGDRSGAQIPRPFRDHGLVLSRRPERPRHRRALEGAAGDARP